MIAPAMAADGESILAITARTDNFSAMDKDCVRELWEDFLARGSAASGYAFLVAREEGGAQGYICYGPTPLTEGTFDVYWLAVDPAARRQGWGRQLLARAEQEMAQQGARLIVIETSGLWSYQATRRFYESCDYRFQAVVHDFYAPGDDLILYGKRLR